MSQRHAARDAFTFVAAVDAGGRIVGFAYRYCGGPGQWWHDAVHAAMRPAQRKRWLRPGHVELAELHVAPAWCPTPGGLAMSRDTTRRGVLAGIAAAPAIAAQAATGERPELARLHDELLASYPDAPTSVLSTQTGNAPALALYEGRGWVTVVPELRFASSGGPYAILGLDLAGTHARTPV